ncbi:MAG: hypothetical protein JXB30_08540, partial [Anaerolineae bacterium]|nr:hypothetical protein [Anaerolineae bacterium]
MASISIDQQIMERIRELDEAQKQRVLEFVTHTARQPSTYSARELLSLPPAERQRLVAAAFEAAADEDFETFEAYS